MCVSGGSYSSQGRHCVATAMAPSVGRIGDNVPPVENKYRNKIKTMLPPSVYI